MNTNPKSKRILFYGDSLVWGKIPGKALRFNSNQRFTGIVQKILGNDYEIIESGLRARTALGDNKFFADRDGFKQFASVVGSQLPLDQLVILLGTNDANTRFDYNSKQIAQNLLKYPKQIIELVEFFKVVYPEIIFICPPIVRDQYLEDLIELFKGAEEKMRDLPKELKSLCEQNGFRYLDSNDYVAVSNVDGIHLDLEANRILGEKIADFLLL